MRFQFFTMCGYEIPKPVNEHSIMIIGQLSGCAAIFIYFLMHPPDTPAINFG